jgi:hypothetical protein
MLVDLFEDLNDVDPHRAEGNAPSTADTLELIIGFDEVLEFVAEPLAEPGSLLRPGIVARGVHGKIGELTGVPGPDPISLKRGCGLQFIIDVKAMAGRTEISADAAADTAHRFFVPEGRIEHPFKR